MDIWAENGVLADTADNHKRSLEIGVREQYLLIYGTSQRILDTGILVHIAL
jgi:hypothetical protein